MAATQRYEKVLNNGYVLELYIQQATQDTSGNRSQAYWELRLTRTGLVSYSNFQNPWTVVVDGERFSGQTTYNFNNYVTLTLGSGYKWIGHNADGTRSFTVSASFTDVAASNYVGDVTEEGFVYRTYTFDTIPRSSTPRLSASHNDAGATVTIFTDRASTGFTHNIRYTLGSAGTFIAYNVTDSYIWTIPMGLLNEFPNAPTGYGHIYLETYSGGSKIGEKAVQFAVRTPASAGPSFTSATFAEGNSAVTALALGAGRYVQSQSRPTFSFTGAAAQYGATIAKYTLQVGTTVLGTSTSASGSSTAGIPTSGTVTFTAVVTDSRGKSASKTYSATVLAYAPPKISVFSVTRSNSAGAIMEDGDYARTTFSASVSSLLTSGSVQKNTIRYLLQSRQKGTTTWALKSNPAATTGTSLSPAPLNYGTYSTSQTHEFQLTITDVFGTAAVQVVSIPVATIFMHWNANLGMGLGKFHTPANGMLDVMGGIAHHNGRRLLFSEVIGAVTGLTAAVAVNAKISGTITFPTGPGGQAPFTVPPIVHMTGENGRFNLSANNITTTGFTWNADNWSPASGSLGTFYWSAAQATPTSAATVAG